MISLWKINWDGISNEFCEKTNIVWVNNNSIEQFFWESAGTANNNTKNMTMSFYCSDLCKGTQIQRIDKDLKTAKETLLMPKVITCFTSQYLRPKTCHKIQYSKIITSNTLVSRKIHGIDGMNKIDHSCEKETILQAKLLQGKACDSWLTAFPPWFLRIINKKSSNISKINTEEVLKEKKHHIRLLIVLQTKIHWLGLSVMVLFSWQYYFQFRSLTICGFSFFTF